MTQGPPTAADLLDAWDRGAGQAGAMRALSLLRAACPGWPVEELVHHSVGTRDRLLLRLRERAFGSRLGCTAACPECHEPLEFSLRTHDLASSPPPEHGELTISVDGYRVRFRLPDSADLIVLQRRCRDAGQAVAELLDRCVLEAVRDGEAVQPALLPPHVLDVLDDELQAADPQADVLVSLSCPACGCEWEEGFDIASYLSDELDSWARHVIRDVHSLASAYGWREPDILAMSAERRRAYLDLVEG